MQPAKLVFVGRPKFLTNQQTSTCILLAYFDLRYLHAEISKIISHDIRSDNNSVKNNKYIKDILTPSFIFNSLIGKSVKHVFMKNVLMHRMIQHFGCFRAVLKSEKNVKLID